MLKNSLYIVYNINSSDTDLKMSLISCLVYFTDTENKLNKDSIAYFNEILPRAVKKFRFTFRISKTKTEFPGFPAMVINNRPFIGLDIISQTIEKILMESETKVYQRKDAESELSSFQVNALGGLKRNEDGKFIIDDDEDGDDAEVSSNADRAKERTKHEEARRKINPETKKGGVAQQIGSTNQKSQNQNQKPQNQNQMSQNQTQYKPVQYNGPVSMYEYKNYDMTDLPIRPPETKFASEKEPISININATIDKLKGTEDSESDDLMKLWASKLGDD